MNEDLFTTTVGAASAQPETALRVLHTAEIMGESFQIYGTAENPLFLAKDVAGWIEHSNHRAMLDSVDEDEKTKQLYPVNNPYGGYQVEEQWFLTESGIYEVLMLSRKPIAKAFKKQVKQILHEIRTKGGYIHATPDMSDEEIMARGIMIANQTIERQKLRLAEQEKQLQLQAPAVEYCNDVLSASNLHTVNSIAVHMGVSAKRLNQFLIEQDWIYKQGDIYCPSCKIRGKGYCDYHVVPYINRNGDKMTREHLKWTETGRRAIVELWNRHFSKKIA